MLPRLGGRREADPAPPCPTCKSPKTRRHGTFGKDQVQRYRCQACSLTFSNHPPRVPIPALTCPHCGEYVSKVIDSRPTPQATIMRRRECATCRRRFTTLETVQTTADGPTRIIGTSTSGNI